MFAELDIVLFVDKRLFACEKKEKVFFLKMKRKNET